MNKNQKLEIAKNLTKLGVTIVVGTGTSIIATNLVKTYAPTDLSRYKQFTVGLGSLAIVTAISSAALKPIDDFIDGFFDGLMEVSVIDETVETTITNEELDNGA